MRKVLDEAKNGQALNEVVSYNDLTIEERKMLIIPVTNKIEDYANFQVRHNKKGELLGVKVHELSEKKKAEIDAKSEQPNILDVYVAFGRSETPIKRSDRAGAINKLKRNGVYEKSKKAFKNNIL